MKQRIYLMTSWQRLEWTFYIQDAVDLQVLPLKNYSKIITKYINSILQSTLYCLQSLTLQFCIAKHLVWVEELAEDDECGVSRVHPVPCILQSILYVWRNSLKMVILVSVEFVLFLVFYRASCMD